MFERIPKLYTRAGAGSLLFRQTENVFLVIHYPNAAIDLQSVKQGLGDGCSVLEANHESHVIGVPSQHAEYYRRDLAGINPLLGLTSPVAMIKERASNADPCVTARYVCRS
jgi:hypothetical protein